MLSNALMTLVMPKIFRKFREKTGFSLIEALVVMAMVAIVATLAIPRLSSLRDDLALKGATKTLAADLQYARVASLRRQSRIVVSLTNNASSYQIFVDANDNASLDAGETVLKSVALPQAVTLSSVAFFGCATGPQFVRGQPSCLAGGGNGSLRLVSGRTNSFYKIKLSRSGRVVVCDKNSDC